MNGHPLNRLATFNNDVLVRQALERENAVLKKRIVTLEKLAFTEASAPSPMTDERKLEYYATIWHHRPEDAALLHNVTRTEAQPPTLTRFSPATASYRDAVIRPSYPVALPFVVPRYRK
jgi:hypothetical protein